MYKLSEKFPSKRAFITGAASGLGREVCRELAKDKWTIGICDISEKGLYETADLITNQGGKPIPFILDVADRIKYELVAKEFLAKAGGIDLLMNNAGVGDGALFEEYGLDNWEWIVGVNQMSVIYGCHYFIPVMKKQKGGQIINVSSIASMTSAPFMGGYNATKAAVKAMSETLYAELKQFNIGVSVMMPFFFRTNITQHARGNQGSGELAYYMVHGSKVNANEVAVKTLKLVGRGRFYVLLPKEAKLFNWWKRIFPMSLLNLNGKMAGRQKEMLQRAKKMYDQRVKEGVAKPR